MKHLMPFDEINRFNEDLALTTYIDENGKLRTRKDRKDVIDEIWDMLIMAYLYGNEAVNDEFGFSIEPDYDLLTEDLKKRIGGKTTEERISEYLDDGDFESLGRVIETEGHRLYNRGVLDTANDASANNAPTQVTLRKRWNTMLDNRVRETHDFLEGVTVPLDDVFTTIDGDSAEAPGDFEDPANNVNCRCLLDIVTA